MSSTKITSFPQFLSFPPEIHSLILESCQPNDLTCLRLTCKHLYNNLAAVPKQSISLGNEDKTCPLCGNNCKRVGCNSYARRQECHKQCYEAKCELNKELGRSPPSATNKKCRTSWASIHCECYTKTGVLHARLRSWMPKGLNYCGVCDKFTKRKPQHKGRCYHGFPKPRVCKPTYWSHTSRGGSFGRCIWKKWFNNRAMNRLERRLATPDRQRNGSDRYALRKLDAMELDTKIARDSRGSSW